MEQDNNYLMQALDDFQAVEDRLVDSSSDVRAYIAVVEEKQKVIEEIRKRAKEGEFHETESSRFRFHASTRYSWDPDKLKKALGAKKAKPFLVSTLKVDTEALKAATKEDPGLEDKLESCRTAISSTVLLKDKLDEPDEIEFE